MILYIENPKKLTQKLLELISEFSRVPGYKINIQKSVTFLYTNKQKEKVKDNSLKLAKKQTNKQKKNLGINLTKEVKDLYNENYKHDKRNQR